MTLTSSYAHGTGTTPLLGETIGANLAATARRFGDREAIVDRPTSRRWTYAELDRWVTDVARGLVARGIRPGDRVGIWSPNCAEWIALQYATARIGVVLVNVNPAYRTSELEFVLRQSGVRLLVSATTFKTSDYRAMVDEVRGRIGGLEDVVYVGDPTWDGLVAAGDAVDADEVDRVAATVRFDDPVNIQYTSGTTGFPKGATLSHHNLLNNGFFVGELVGYTEADRVCLPVPFYHCFGMVMGNLGATTHGSTIVIPAPLFDPAATLAAVAEERCTSLYGVPTMFIAELALDDFATYDLSSLRTGIMAGSPCPVEIMKRVIAEMHMDEVSICYGMTETSPVSTQTRVDDDLGRRTATVGRVMPHLEVKVVDPVEGTVVAPGVPGELCTRGYSVMLGYWDQPEKTAEAIDAARWMHTGDLAVMADDGYVSIVGRIKDLVIRGGENIYPREIEEFLYGHPDIEDVQVIGVPDERYGEELMAWIRMKPGRPALGADEVRAYCSGRIAHQKIPRFVKVVDGFPMTVTGKVRKVEMREVSVAELGLGPGYGHDMTVDTPLRQETEPEKVGLDTDRLTRIDRHFARYVDDGRLAGWLALVARRGQVAHLSTYGHRDLERAAPVGIDTLWRLYSMTKPITSVAAMMLYEEGAFDLRDPVARWIPSLASPRVYTGGPPTAPTTRPAAEPIRVWHLLTHTAGLTYGFHHVHPVDAIYRHAGYEWGSPRGVDLAGAVDAWAALPLLFDPGSEWAYSVATDVLGRLVEVVSGMPLDRFFEERIFRPLGMTDARFWVDEPDADRLATLYGAHPDDGTAVPLAAGRAALQPPEMLSGGGGIIGTARDYHRFTQMLLGGGALDGVRLLGPRTVALMARNHLPGGADLESFGRRLFAETSYEGVGFGLGVSVSLDNAAAKLAGSRGEYGWGGAASTAFWVDPLEELTVVFLTQLLPSSTHPIRPELKSLVYQAIVD